VLDVPGNHDRWNVLHRYHEADMFSNVSFTLSALPQTKDRIKRVHSFDISRGVDCFRFIALDLSPETGIRRPANFFGLATSATLRELEEALAQPCAKDNTVSMRQIVFGHYPLAFVAAGSGAKVRRLLLKYNATAYLSGHLHILFGERVWRSHYRGNNEGEGLREMLVPDWKESRGFRVLTLHSSEVLANRSGKHVSLSSVDVRFPSFKPFQPKHTFGTFVADFLKGQLGELRNSLGHFFCFG